MRFDPGLWLLCHLRPLSDRRGDGSGYCSVCGSSGRFVRNSWVMPRDLARDWPPEFVDRESQFCTTCGCSRRVRRLADVVIRTYGAGAACVEELVSEPAFRTLRIAELNSVGRMHAFLEDLPYLTYAEYPDEDIMSLSYGDSVFDLVLTSDTLEHVADPIQGLREVHRVLRPGGRHIFTVPLDPRRSTTTSRDGLAPQFHGRGGGPFALVTRRSDMLAHTDFGADVGELLASLSYDPEVHFGGVDTVFSARRPPATRG
ncbi:MAG: class I SAM-dependent methyltransferase [Gaiellaceae bacterium]